MATSSCTKLVICACLGLIPAMTGCENIDDRVRSDVRDGDIAALVDNHPIYTEQVTLEAQAQSLVGPGQDFSPDSPEYAVVVNQLIDQYLLAREAEAHRLHTHPNASHRLESARQRILGTLLLESLTVENVSENAILSMYEAQRELLQLGQEARVRHIVLKSRSNADHALKELANGADFAVLAANVSIDARTRLEGGDLGYLSIDSAPAALRPILRDTPIGQAAGPIKTELGWHVIKMEDRREETPPSLEELRPQIMQFLTLGEIDRELRRLRTLARIEILGDPAPLDPFDLADEEDVPEEAPASATNAQSAPNQ